MSIYNVFSQKLAELHSREEDIKPVFLKMLKTVVLMSLAMAPMFLFTGELFAFVFGPQWREAGVYVQILAPWILLGFVVSCFASIPLVFGKQRKALFLEMVSAVFQVAPIVIGAKMLSLGIKPVLLITMILYTSLLLYSLNWFYGMIKGEK
jgi:O-antigen/teichoic acid export membrane protein